MSDTHNFDLQELNLTFRNEFLRLYAFLSRLHNVVNKICEIIIHDKCDYRLLSIYDDRPIHTSSSKLFNTSLSPPDRKLASRGGPPEREKWEGDEIRRGRMDIPNLLNVLAPLHNRPVKARTRYIGPCPCAEYTT